MKKIYIIILISIFFIVKDFFEQKKIRIINSFVCDSLCNKNIPELAFRMFVL